MAVDLPACASVRLQPSVSLLDSAVVEGGRNKHVEYSILVVVCDDTRVLRWWKVARRSVPSYCTTHPLPHLQSAHGQSLPHALSHSTPVRNK